MSESDHQVQGRTGLLIIYSPRSRCFLSARAIALPRCASRSLRQATYSDEPTATLPPARQNVSSSSLKLELTGSSLRLAQAVSVSAASASARRSGADCRPMRKYPGSFVVADHSRPKDGVTAARLWRESINSKAFVRDGWPSLRR